jgi:hypothetical protein
MTIPGQKSVPVHQQFTRFQYHTSKYRHDSFVYSLNFSGLEYVAGEEGGDEEANEDE